MLPQRDRQRTTEQGKIELLSHRPWTADMSDMKETCFSQEERWEIPAQGSSWRGKEQAVAQPPWQAEGGTFKLSSQHLLSGHL